MAPPGEIVYLPNTETYNLWASTYDTDGNILQAIDNYQILHDLFPRIFGFSRCLDTATAGRASRCTAHDTSDLARLVERDAGPCSVQATCGHCFSAVQSAGQHITYLREFDISSPYPPDVPQADLIFSTLVLEHLPMSTFFTAVSAATKAGGKAIVTTMHSAMGQTAVNTSWTSGVEGAASTTGAGFKDAKGRKVRAAESWGHDEDEVESVARDHGLVVLGRRREVRVTPQMLQGDGDGGGRGIKLGERGRKWIGTNVWAGWTFRKT
ncbi:hypothetical protein KVT40_000972 [Elsinoe batatas]|uniref:Methyltransferase type 11 domain-containing protein n=1 Tax=Elsinoe batatas TaxID=2601811 RepID=A0A8K0PKS6_9PEZI|nr:hypothetical protein KVT40_000972 [Elsinoe batatas]